MLRQPARWLAFAGLAVACVVAAVVVPLYALGPHAPPPVEATALGDAESAAGEAAAAARNLRTGAYSYAMYVNTSEPGEDPYTTTYQRVVVDNPARTYYAAVRTPPDAVNWSRPPVGYYGNGPAGYQYVPAYGTSMFVSDDERDRWTPEDGVEYHPRRNALDDPGRLADANATVLAANRTRLVVRVTDRRVAAEVGYPHPVDYDDPNWTANLTVSVDRRAGVVDRAVFRYADHRGQSSRAVYRVRDFGAARVERPAGTSPPTVRETVYRLDLGARTLQWLLGGGGAA